MVGLRFTRLSKQLLDISLIPSNLLTLTYNTLERLIISFGIYTFSLAT